MTYIEKFVFVCRMYEKHIDLVSDEHTIIITQLRKIWRIVLSWTRDGMI